MNILGYDVLNEIGKQHFSPGNGLYSYNPSNEVQNEWNTFTYKAHTLTLFRGGLFEMRHGTLKKYCDMMTKTIVEKMMMIMYVSVCHLLLLLWLLLLLLHIL